MSGRIHRYATTVRWIGNRGTGTSAYGAYDRAHEISAAGKPDIAGSSDPAFRGDHARWSPEDLFLASLSACHQLWYLHLCSRDGVVVMAYEDHAEGEMAEGGDGGGRFVSVTLRPRVTLAAGSDGDRAMALHAEAHALCFIANSVNFPVGHAAEIVVEA